MQHQTNRFCFCNHSHNVSSYECRADCGHDLDQGDCKSRCSSCEDNCGLYYDQCFDLIDAASVERRRRGLATGKGSASMAATRSEPMANAELQAAMLRQRRFTRKTAAIHNAAPNSRPVMSRGLQSVFAPPTHRPHRALPQWVHSEFVSFMYPKKLAFVVCVTMVPACGQLALLVVLSWVYLLILPAPCNTYALTYSITSSCAGTTRTAHLPKHGHEIP